MTEAAVQDARRAFYERIATRHMTPLWEVVHQLVSSAPSPAAEPVVWRYGDIRDDILESGGLISAKEAVRRVLVLENPGLAGTSRVTDTLYAGMQLILPGEVAPAHRHSQSALRFVIEGEGAYTAVEGERAYMAPGDFVITPTWCWHDHGNESEAAMIWLDGLDIPIVALLRATFAEPYPEDAQVESRPSGDSLARYGAGLLPVDHEARSPVSPLFHYPFERTREALETMRRREAWDPCHGLKLRYVNPATGGPAMATIGTFMQLLPEGFAGEDYRSTDGQVFSVVEGRGRTVVGATVLEWGPRDTFVVPAWARHRHLADADAVLFSFSDRPVQTALGLWREARGNGGDG